MFSCDNRGIQTKELITPYWLDSLVSTSKLCKQCAVDFSYNNHSRVSKSPEEIKKIRIEAMKKAREVRAQKLAAKKQAKESLHAAKEG